MFPRVTQITALATFASAALALCPTSVPKAGFVLDVFSGEDCAGHHQHHEGTIFQDHFSSACSPWHEDPITHEDPVKHVGSFAFRASKHYKLSLFKKGDKSKCEKKNEIPSKTFGTWIVNRTNADQKDASSFWVWRDPPKDKL